MKIAVLGAGAFGSVLGNILTNNGNSIKYYDPILKVSLEESLNGAEMMLLAAPSAAALDLLPQLPYNLPLIIATKGFLTDKIFAEFKDYMVLSGPGFAADLEAHKKTTLTATSQEITKMFGTDYLSFDYTSDRLGVLMCGALKNVYAVLAGLLDLHPGTTQHGEFIDEAVAEMKEILKANGAKPDTVNLSCGRGDLKITCASPSRNYEFGQILRQHGHSKTPEKTVEGIATLKRIKDGEIIVPNTAPKLKCLVGMSDVWV